MSAIGRGVAKIFRLLLGCVVAVLVIEGMSFLALGAIALRGGHASTYFKALLPHPAVSRHVGEVAGWTFNLLTREGHIGYGSKVRTEFEWHPLLGHYGHRLPKDGSLRRVPTGDPNELVVYVLGGSVVEANGITTNLQHRLQETLPDREVTVINEGVGGFMSTQEMVLLMTKILPFHAPQYVIAVDGYNDWLATTYNLLNHFKEKTGITEEMWPHAELSWFYYWFEEWQARKAIDTISGASLHLAGLVSKRVLVHTYTGWFLNHLRNWVYYRVQGRDPHVYASWAQYEQTPTLPRQRAELNAINEKMMAEACQARDCRFFWVLQPGLPYRGEAMTAEEQGYYDSRPSAYWQSLDHYYRDVQALAKDDPFWASRFLDLSRPVPDIAGSFFVDTVHLTDAGSDRTAEYLAALILADIEGRTPALQPVTGRVRSESTETSCSDCSHSEGDA